MRKVIFVGSPEGSSEESLARMDAAIQEIREAADALRAALAEDRLNEMQAAVVAEREACAAICAREARHYGKIPDLGHYQQGRGEGATSIEKKIRARGKE